MKIYQLHKYGGDGEDYRDCIIGSYLHKEKAEQEMAKAEQEEKLKRLQAEKCSECPCCANIEDNALMADLMRKHCNHSDIYCDDEGELFCKNYYYHWIDSNFNIEEVGVIE